MDYGNTNQGQIWPNKRKETDGQPDFRGTLNVKGEEFSISAWKQEGGADPKSPSLSFSVQPKTETTIDQPRDYIIEADNPKVTWD